MTRALLVSCEFLHCLPRLARQKAEAWDPLCSGMGGSRGQQIETILVNMVKPRLY